MKKIITLTIIVLILAVGGFIYLPKAGNSLTAMVSLFSPLNDREAETTRLLGETRLEVGKLQEEISLIKEKLEREEGLRVELELEYQSEMITLAAKLENLAQTVNSFNQEIAQLAIILNSEPKFAEKSCFININTASKEDLQKLTGIGPVLAQGIIDARPFSSVYDLVKVDGIGETTLEKITEQGCAYVDEIDNEDNEEEFIEESIGKETAGICPVNINTASKEELQAITGIGPVLAQRIIDARPFFSISDLLKVSGIGEATLEKIIAQDCAFALGYTGGGGGGGGGGATPPPPPEPEPKINLSYPEENPVNKEIEVTLSALNLKNTAYDVKISIENDGNLSQIYNQEKEGEDKWQSSAYYLTEVFFSTSFEGQFRLKIRDDKGDFRGEAEIIVRLRETGKTNFLEFKGKINIIEPEQEESEQEEEQEQPEEQEPEPPQNLLLNEFFEEWADGIPVGWLDGVHIGDAYQSTEAYAGNYSLGIKHSYIVPRNIEQHITHNEADGAAVTYYGKLWVRGSGWVQIGIKRPGYIYAHSDWVKFEGVDWTELRIEKIKDGREGTDLGFRIRTSAKEQISGDGDIDVDLRVGAAWLGTAPPDDWLD